VFQLNATMSPYAVLPLFESDRNVELGRSVTDLLNTNLLGARCRFDSVQDRPERGYAVPHQAKRQ
jgi:hypothetical protein